MPLRIKLFVLFAFTAFVTLANTISFSGPVFVKGPNEGQPCTVGTPFCVIGDPNAFEVFGAQITSPSGSNPNWTLEIMTNYGVTLPGSPDVVPSYFSPQVNGTFGAGDFLIQWNGVDYGIVITPHDGYTAGDLYLSPNGYQTSQDVLSTQPGTNVFNPGHDVLLASGANQVGTGTLTAAQTGDGTTSALYTITVSFTAPPAFLTTGTFSIDFSSYDCANGVIEGSGSTGTFTGGAGGDVPEPGTLLLCVAPLLLFGLRLARRRRPLAA